MMYRKAVVQIVDHDRRKQARHIVCVESLEAGLELGWNIETMRRRGFVRSQCNTTVYWLEDDDHYSPMLIDGGLDG